MPEEEEYCFEFAEEGQQSLDILDQCFNPTTQEFLLKHGLEPGMNVLDLGCGTGVMSCWIANQIGAQGKLVGIDNNKFQVKICQNLSKKQKLCNCRFEVMNAYDINNLNEKFDIVFCRFLLHHLNEPDKVILNVHEILKPNGIFICEEGIMTNAFSYPPTKAFEGPPEDDSLPDKNIGKKLYYKFYQAGFKKLKAKLIQPLLITEEDKSMLLPGLIEFKKSYIAEGHSEDEWQELYDMTTDLVNDKSQIVGFYQSCQITGIK